MYCVVSYKYNDCTRILTPIARPDLEISNLNFLFFGTGFTIAKPAVMHFPPLFMMLMVYCGIAIALTLTHGPRLKTPLMPVIAISAFAVTIQGALLFWGLRGVSATAANLILQIQVPMAVVLDWLIMKEKLDLRKSAGTALAIAGVAIVIGLPEQPPAFIPTMLIIAGAFFWALGQVLARKLGRDDGIGLLKANAYGSLPQLMAATAFFETGQLVAVRAAGPLEWSMLAFVGVVGFYLAYMCWYSLLKTCRMDEVAPFILLMPVVGILTAFFVLGETITPAQIIGGMVILAGLAIVSGVYQRRSRAASPAS